MHLKPISKDLRRKLYGRKMKEMRRSPSVSDASSSAEKKKKKKKKKHKANHKLSGRLYM